MLEIGSSLREARVRRGLELAEVEAATLIRARYIEALEHEQFELLPAGSYRRSFLREYAEFLGLDGDTYASEYDLRLASLEPEPPSPAPHPGSVLLRLLGELPLTPRTFAVASAVALGGIAVWQLGGSGGSGLVRTTQPASQTHAHTPPHAHHPAATTPPAATQPAPQRPPLLLTLNRH
jgi:cytoskeleton protein RodZ